MVPLSSATFQLFFKAADECLQMLCFLDVQHAMWRQVASLEAALAEANSKIKEKERQAQGMFGFMSRSANP